MGIKNDLENAKKMALVAFDAMEDKKAEEVCAIEIGEVTSIADYFIIGSGNSSSQVEAIVDNVKERLYRELGADVKRVEGTKNSGWILLDYGDIVVHVFSKEDRLFYDLERIWRDGKKLSKSDLQ